MRIRRALICTGIAFTLLPAYATTALAGPEWCDDGSPPPNDWRFRPTGAPSAGSSTNWLRSTTSWELDPSVNVIAVVKTLEGGVARGMTTALSHAGTKEPGERPERSGGDRRAEQPQRDRER